MKNKKSQVASVHFLSIPSHPTIMPTIEPAVAILRKYQSIKRIAHFPDIVNHIKNGNVVIEKECLNAFKGHIDIGMDYIAHVLLVKIFTYYQENACFPESVGFGK